MVLVQKLVFKARDMAIDCYGNKRLYDNNFLVVHHLKMAFGKTNIPTLWLKLTTRNMWDWIITNKEMDLLICQIIHYGEKKNAMQAKSQHIGIAKM